MKEEFKELEKITLQEDLERLSVEDIMNISGCGKEFAQVYYDSIHGLNMTSPVSAEEYLQMLKRGEF